MKSTDEIVHSVSIHLHLITIIREHKVIEIFLRPHFRFKQIDIVVFIYWANIIGSDTHFAMRNFRIIRMRAHLKG